MRAGFIEIIVASSARSEWLDRLIIAAGEAQPESVLRAMMLRSSHAAFMACVSHYHVCLLFIHSHSLALVRNTRDC
jgi:hypothetical protein